VTDWAGDPETRVSMTGFIIYLLNVPIFWRSKSQKGVTLLSTEASHFVREFIEDSFIKIEFVRSVKNDSDLFTKNVNQELYAKHTKKLLEDNQVYSTS
jgi:hypothetical protein